MNNKFLCFQLSHRILLEHNVDIILYIQSFKCQFKNFHKMDKKETSKCKIAINYVLLLLTFYYIYNDAHHISILAQQFFIVLDYFILYMVSKSGFKAVIYHHILVDV